MLESSVEACFNSVCPETVSTLTDSHNEIEIFLSFNRHIVCRAKWMRPVGELDDARTLGKSSPEAIIASPLATLTG